MTSNTPNNSKNQGFFSTGLFKAIVLVSVLAWLLSTCGTEDVDSDIATTVATPSASTSKYIDSIEERVNVYISYMNFCTNPEQVALMEQDLELLEAGLLRNEDFSGYLLEIGKSSIEIEKEGQRALNEFGAHENILLTQEFGSFGRDTLNKRMRITQLNYENFQEILDNWKSLKAKTLITCEKVNLS
jgi:hypothetical protein